MNRFWRLADRSEEYTQCWPWTGSVNNRGYGQFRFEGHIRLAHHVAYILEKGPIPDGLVLDHTCEFKLCVRPDHLEAVSNAENRRRSRRVRCPRGHLMMGDNVRPGRSCRQCNIERMRQRRAGK